MWHIFHHDSLPQQNSTRSSNHPDEICCPDEMTEGLCRISSGHLNENQREAYILPKNEWSLGSAGERKYSGSSNRTVIHTVIVSSYAGGVREQRSLSRKSRTTQVASGKSTRGGGVRVTG